jgi:[methyl-Co(III) methanol-specific corrinoid protein]:coenzyme M methyltransferase
MAITEKERLLSTLHDSSPARPAVISPGGMMDAVVTETLNSTGINFPQCHANPTQLADLTRAVHESTGFENFGLPFCMTIEAEVLGSPINYGSSICVPKIASEPFKSVRDVKFYDIKSAVQEGRVPVLAAAIKSLAKNNTDVPVVATITGPISLGMSLVDPQAFLKELYRNPKEAHSVLDYASEFLEAYIRVLADNGATVIAIADPSATGEILGAKLFREYALPQLNRVTEAARRAGLPVIVHICGNINAIKPILPELKAEAISLDSIVSLGQLKQEYLALKLMGNVSTYLLEFGQTAKVSAAARNLVEEKIDIISPACGLSITTPLANIQALTDAVKSPK